MTSELTVKLLYKTYEVEPQNESSLISFQGIAHLWFISRYVSYFYRETRLRFASVALLSIFFSAMRETQIYKESCMAFSQMIQSELEYQS